jgi:hypothetical protein
MSKGFRTLFVRGSETLRDRKEEVEGSGGYNRADECP